MRVLVLSSGGVDSSTALAMAVKENGAENVVSLSFFYGQKHDKELKAAEEVAGYYGVEHITLDVSSIFAYSSSSLLKGSEDGIPKLSYAEQMEGRQSPVSTYVPFRNGLFISAAAGVALSKNCSLLLYGAHRDDAAMCAYPDCSAEFDRAMGEAVWEGSGKQLTLKAPFVNWTKSEVVKKGLELKVPYELTWSCYEGADEPCGKCGTCRDRAAAFAANAAEDPALHRHRS